MSFFRREEGGSDPAADPMSRHPEPTAATAATVVAPGTHFEGTVTGATEVRIEGEVAGDVQIESRLIIGRQGKVTGTVVAQTVIIAGTMEGDVRAEDRIELGASGVAQGDLSAPRVVIAEGAFFKGRVEMGSSRAGGEAGGRGGQLPSGGRGGMR